jgi:hypothetical protein
MLSMIALLAACAQGSGCAAGTGAKQRDAQGSLESSDARDEREAREGKGEMSVTMTKPPPPVEQSRTAPVVVAKPVPAKPVREGPAPLVYLLPAGGALRVVDTTAGAEIAATAAESRSILRIDALTGVTIGKQTLLRGPLPPGHEYAIYLTTGSDNEVRQGVLRPRP